jgi:hypothetical protein
MPCHWHKLPDGSMVHINMAAPRKRHCAFCDCPDAKALCDWPMVKGVAFKIEELNPGDILVQPTLPGWRARLLEATVIDGQYAVCAEVRVTLITQTPLFSGLKKPPFDIRFTLPTVSFAKYYRVERPGTCDKPCCFRCRRHVGPDRDYCMDHWDAQAPAAEPLLRVPMAGVRVLSGRALDRAKQRRLFE